MPTQPLIMEVSTDNVADLSKLAGKGAFEWVEVDEPRWDKSFPFQLVVLQAGETGYSVYEKTTFTLPIGPEEMTISTPFAISTQATLGGIIEQHGGAPFRQISFSGSLGVLPLRASGETIGKVDSFFQTAGAITGGTIDGTLGAAQNVISTALSTGAQFTANQYEDQDIPARATGYYQFLQLQKFLESYVEAKKRGTAVSRGLRLALMVWKEQVAYIVTPRQFNVVRSAQTPFEYRYSLQLLAWRRVHAKSIGSAARSVPSLKVRGPGWFKAASNKVEQARRTISQVRNVMTAMRGDMETTIGGGIRDVSLFLKEAGGLAKDATDFPAEMTRAWEQTVRAEWDRLRANLTALDPTLKAKVDAVDAEVAAYRSGTKGGQGALATYLSSTEHNDFRALIDPDVLSLPASLRAAVQDESDRVRSLNSAEFVAMRDRTLAFAADYADRVGLGNAAYNKALGLSTAPQMREPTEDDFAALGALLNIAQPMGALALDSDDSKAPTTIEYVAGLATSNGLSVRVPRSKLAVPFPYGYTLQGLAREYLGDADRWMEIAALNDLRAPWVDEQGTEQPLLVNAHGNHVVLSDASKLAVGQVVRLSSEVAATERRRVLNIEKLSAEMWRVTLDGEGDLDRFVTADEAALLAFLPGTVNSGCVVYIPSDDEPTAEPRYAPDESDVTAFLTAGTVDGALTETGDLVITADGDWPYVYGLAALVQYARVALSTRQGSMSLHPDFGIPVEAGDSLADATAEDIVAQVKAMFQSAPPFTGVRSILVERNGPATRIGLELGVQGSDTPLPVAFTLR